MAHYTVNFMIKDHYLEVSKMTTPPKMSPPSPYTVVKGALDNGGPILKGTFNDEKISIFVMRLVDIIPEVVEMTIATKASISCLFMLRFISQVNKIPCIFCVGCILMRWGFIQFLRDKRMRLGGSLWFQLITVALPVFEDIDEKLRDALHGYIILMSMG